VSVPVIAPASRSEALAWTVAPARTFTAVAPSRAAAPPDHWKA
jgi:hypothetical protein